MTSPKPIELSAGANPSPLFDPQPFIIVTDEAAPTVDATPADAAAVAADLQALVDYLTAIGIIPA